ncbi:MAG: radical SAM family heme chaperone HemW [Oscillospiraceae bacterium]|nr:radical SAM family heme chaperone HemW [Oscillospiraceae bacterium]MDD4413311.1 radical SAM family heme chaperone HemW [Oscillospiraceae bacterium]
MPNPIGLYIHIPFCISKCPYCDFYSLTDINPDILNSYTHTVVESIEQWHKKLEGVTADTLYLGGGTPSLLGGERISRIIRAAGCFIIENAEITMEANPADGLDDVFAAFSAVGGNRISIGMQTANDNQLEFLGRRHRHQDVVKAVEAAKSAGINNISLDVMLGLKGQTVSSVTSTLCEAHNLGATHISAYMLKVEEGTPFYKNQDELCLPDDDTVAELYLSACQTLESFGFEQYEMSNFALPGFQSRHNLKYWNADPYLGIGPAAHSFIDGRRFYYTRDQDGFIKGSPPVDEQSSDTYPNAGETEYLMLRLRLNRGIKYKEFEERFGHAVPKGVTVRAASLPNKLAVVDSDGIHLTPDGFLVSNTLITRILNG